MATINWTDVTPAPTRVIPDDAPHCDQCDDGRMIRKTGAYGEFMGCSTYPACRSTTGIDGQRRDFRNRNQRSNREEREPGLKRKVEVLEELLTNAIERIETLEYYIENEEAA